MVCFWCAGFLLLVFFPAPVSLGKFLQASLREDAWPLARVGLLRGDVVDAVEVVLVVVPGIVPFKVGHGLGAVNEEAPGIFRGASSIFLKACSNMKKKCFGAIQQHRSPKDCHHRCKMILEHGWRRRDSAFQCRI